MSIDWKKLERQQREAEAKGWQCVTGSVIFSADNTAFVQKRALSKALFPGGWDIVGGHVEAGESLQESLRREVFEETGWELDTIYHLIHVLDWSAEKNGNTLYRREFDFVISVQGNLQAPKLEKENFSEHRWISPNEIALLSQDRPTEDEYIRNTVEKAFSAWNG